jgi:hypothetical protein
MKSESFYLPFNRLPIQTLLLGVGLLMGVSASAQNLLKNGDFEQRLGPTNWTVGYLHGGESDFEIQNRIRGASLYSQGSATKFFGGGFRPLTIKLAHAYFTQTVSNLTPSHVYQFVGNMREDWWKGTGWDYSNPDNPVPNNLTHKYRVYMELIGGQGTPLPDGRFSMVATNDFTDSAGASDTNIDNVYDPTQLTYATIIWRPFYAQQTPDTNGRIEVRLHYNKMDFAIYDKTWTSAAYFDDIWLTFNP